MTQDKVMEEALSIEEVARMLGHLARRIGVTYVVITMANAPEQGGSDVAMATNCDAPSLIAQLRFMADQMESGAVQPKEPS